MHSQQVAVSHHHRNHGSWLVNLLVIAGIVIILAAVLLPTFKHSTGCNMGSNCQSNLKQIGNSFKMYLSDWNDTFPTNRRWNGNGIVSHVRLTTPDAHGNPRVNADGKPIRYEFGPNWVEALYPYVESLTKSTDATSVWKCVVTCEKSYPEDSRTAAVTYAFNRNLVEKNEKIVRSSANLMMVREMDRMVDAELRPTNNSTWTSRRPPVSPFLTSRDCRIGRTEANLHGHGSHILFVDGHVKLISLNYTSMKPKYDNVQRQWFNFYKVKPANTIERTLNMSIAITP
ncbi:MAG: hypothetical protein ABFD54_07575 [Armatimonadota bacterium]|nr:hypothetical protein [bacterium]